MNFKIQTQTTYNCPLERAFKAPILCDVTKVHTGFGLMPKVTKTTHDEDWGKVGSIKIIHAGKSLTFGGGEVATDKVVARIENQYWKVEVGNFKSWMLNIRQFTFEWTTREISPNRIQINYDYTIHGKGIFFIPLQWLFAKVFYKMYMQQVLENVRKMAEGDEPFLYD
ncbi:MAG: hypothetical protein SFV52_11150 [Saprospiraceae bacterium]|nr:hypothetical protein [Saprospiraceae bacterium]